MAEVNRTTEEGCRSNRPSRAAVTLCGRDSQVKVETLCRNMISSTYRFYPGGRSEVYPVQFHVQFGGSFADVDVALDSATIIGNRFLPPNVSNSVKAVLTRLSVAAVAWGLGRQVYRRRRPSVQPAPVDAV